MIDRDGGREREDEERDGKTGRQRNREKESQRMIDTVKER